MKGNALVKYYFQNPSKLFFRVGRRTFLRLLSDEQYIKLIFKSNLGYPLNLETPKTFNEKLNWLKLYDRRSIYTTMVDKYEVKKYVASIIGDEYIIPTLGVWDRADDIDFDALPDKFVLKCTHNSGGVVVCSDRDKLDVKTTKKKLATYLKRNYFWWGREWPYKDVKPRIIAEQYMKDSRTGELPDYKFFVFNGEVKVLFIATERGSVKETKFDFFDADFNHLPFLNGHPNAEIMPRKPLQFELMKELASKLSDGIPQIRVDMYEVDGRVYFGEFTFFHYSGFKPFIPQQWDKVLGEMIIIPESYGDELHNNK